MVLNFYSTIRVKFKIIITTITKNNKEVKHVEKKIKDELHSPSLTNDIEIN